MRGQEKTKKPIYKKWWIWVIVILILAAIGNGMDETETETEVAESEKVEVAAEVNNADVKNEEAGESAEVEKDNDNDNETYTELISVKRNFAKSCFDYEYGSKDYLTFDFEKDKDSLGYHWDSDAISVTTKEGTELEWELTSEDDVSFKFVDSEEYIVEIKYERIKGKEKYQTFTVNKSDIVVGSEFDPSQCTEEPSTTDVTDVDVDTPGVCNPGQTWVKGHYRNGTWVDGHCRNT